MATENNDEKKFKQCTQSIIDAVSNTINNSNEQTDSQPLLNNLRKTIKTILEKSLSSLSKQCRNYLLNVLDEYYYDANTKTLSDSFTADLLDSFLHDLQGRLDALGAFQAAWNGDQAVVQQFIETYPELEDQPGLYETTLLYSAARNNHFDLVQYLIEEAACSVNAQNKEYLRNDEQATKNKATIGSTALHAACYQGHLHIVKYLISHGGDYFLLNSANETPVQNSKCKSDIRAFFKEFLLFGYSTNLSSFPARRIEIGKDLITDCIWEYKPIGMNQWISFTSDTANQLQQSVINQPFENQIRLKTGRDRYQISMTKFLRFTNHSNQIDNSAWIRCRGSSILNFQCYAQWQIMFIKHPTGTINPSPTTEILDMISNENIQFHSWYTVDDQLNLILETAINYRRRYINIALGIWEIEKVTINLETFSFTDSDDTIEGFIRWIPKFISSTDDLTPIDNFQLLDDDDTTVMLLTTACVQQAHENENISAEEMEYYYQLVYENAFQDDDLEFSNKEAENENEPSHSIKVIQGDLLTETTDVIVICSLSKYLVDAVFKAGGKTLKSAFDKKVQENDKNSVISVPSSGTLKSKVVYFVPWKPNSNQQILCQSIEQLVQNVIKKTINDNYQSISFPAIGCGAYECATNLIAKTFMNTCQELVGKYPISIVFVIQPGKTEIYDEFRRYINTSQHGRTTVKEPPVSLTIGNGIIEVKKGDITKQRVDAIISTSSSENLTQILLQAAGDPVRTFYNKQQATNPNASIIVTPSGHLHCRQIFFLKWQPNKDKQILRKSIVDLIANLVQNVLSYKYTSIAFPAIGCGEHACSIDILVKTLVKEIKQQIENKNLSWTVKFIIHPSQQDVYDEFCKQVLSSEHRSSDYQLPSTWERTDDDNQYRFIVPKDSDEYNSIIHKFDEQMSDYYTEIIKLERIQNERWYMQYIAHRKDFKKRLGMNTEKRLYHGCPEIPAESIIKDCFNRSFAGVNGTLYGYGVYFSSRATYSQNYAVPNEDGERCMFVCRVLVGKTTKGDESMKTRPVGFDSTTDGVHMTVTYHDAQAYAEYLITYK